MPVAGWNTRPTLTQPSLAAGTYWLAYLSDSSTLGFRKGDEGELRHYSRPFGLLPATFSRTPTVESRVHWGIYATLNCSSCSLPRSLPPPAPIAGQGYRQVFGDDFDFLNRTNWDDREWWNTPPPPNSQYVRKGVLHLVSRRSQGYQTNIAVTTFSSQKLFRRGYVEARLKWTKGNGSWPAFWMISNAHAANPNWPNPACSWPTCLSAENDVFEGYGNHPDVFTGTVHRNSCECYGVQDRLNSNSWQPQPGVDLSAKFHTYGMLWTKTRITWFLDRRRVMSTRAYDSTVQKMFLLLSMYIGGESQPDATTPDELHTEVDWVRVWQR